MPGTNQEIEVFDVLCRGFLKEKDGTEYPGEFECCFQVLTFGIMVVIAVELL